MRSLLGTSRELREGLNSLFQNFDFRVFGLQLGQEHLVVAVTFGIRGVGKLGFKSRYFHRLSVNLRLANSLFDSVPARTFIVPTLVGYDLRHRCDPGWVIKALIDADISIQMNICQLIKFLEGIAVDEFNLVMF